MSAMLFDSVTRIARHEAAARSIAAIGVVVDVFDGGAVPPTRGHRPASRGGPGAGGYR
jgi:hypothetical protein